MWIKYPGDKKQKQQSFVQYGKSFGHMLFEAGTLL